MLITLMSPSCHFPSSAYCQLVRPSLLLTLLDGEAGETVPADADAILLPFPSMVSLINQVVELVGT